MSFIASFLPELVLAGGALGLFVVSLGTGADRLARRLSLAVALLGVVASLGALGQQALLFDGAYRVDALSQGLKLVFTLGYALVVLLSAGLPDIRSDIRSEYHLFLSLAVLGFTLLASSIELITLVVALELTAFPLYLAVAMRREREGQRSQMESAIKYLMFGVAANGIMFFGFSYLFGLTGTTSLPLMAQRLAPHLSSPLVAAGLLMALAGVWYKLAIFPFHFWTPDVYQGASNETAGLVASLPKLGAVLVFYRLASVAGPEARAVPSVLAVLAGASMLYGNLIALGQSDFKRLLGFSGIAHAGYTLLGFVALSPAGYGASFYYVTAYLLMVLACFTVISRVSRDGTNVGIEELAGLHRRSPLLAATLLVGVFGLAGIPPFAGFMGKLSLFTEALHQGHLALVIFAVVNTAIAIYYYLGVVREACFRDPGDRPAVVLDGPTRVLCVALMVAIVGLGVVPGPVFRAIEGALTAAVLAPH